MTDLNETVTTYEVGGTKYEIDHFGIGVHAQWGQCGVFRDDVQLAEFAVPGAASKPEHRPELPGDEELIDLAKQAVADADKSR